MAKSSPPPGTADIFPEEIRLWRFLEEKAEEVFSLYGYGELRTPVFEYTEVFQRGIGDDTEVVQKEMYTFEDRGGRSLTLRPEGTAGVMRALAGTDVLNGNEKRIFYAGPMFRGEKPAAGRRRQFHQIGVENVGRVAPELDAENISMLMHYLESAGISGAKLLINTRGGFEDRKPASEALKEYFSTGIGEMCEDCRERLGRNVWRILDCKQEQCRKFIDAAPDIVSLFSQETQDYFKRVCLLLDELGVEYEIDSRLVRGLDYYVHTVFEVTHEGLGAQDSIAGGGRYEVFLPESKKPIIGVGFALGMERLIMALDSLGTAPLAQECKPVFLVGLGEKARDANVVLAGKLRKNGIAALNEVEVKSMKAQMRAADRSGARFVIIRGDSELESGLAMLKDMETGEQSELSENSIIETLDKKLNLL